MFQEFKSIDTITGWDDVRKTASFTRNGVNFLLTYKHHIDSQSLSMACFLNTIEYLQEYKEYHNIIFFITNGKFHIDHINAVSKDKISNIVFIQENNLENAIDTIEHYISLEGDS